MFQFPLLLLSTLVSATDDRNDFFIEVARKRATAKSVISLLNEKYFSNEEYEKRYPGFSFHEYFHGYPLPLWARSPMLIYEIIELFYNLCPDDFRRR
jgi:hypothetical protein